MATFRLDSHQITDDGIVFSFWRMDRGESSYTLFIPDSELPNGAPAIRTFIHQKLRRKLRGEGISDRISTLHGEDFTI